MKHPGLPMRTAGFGSWKDAEALRKWSFLRRTPQQRLDWLVDALSIRFLAKAAGKGGTAPQETGLATQGADPAAQAER